MSIISLTDNSILQSPVAFYYSFFHDHASFTEPANFFFFLLHCHGNCFRSMEAFDSLNKKHYLKEVRAITKGVSRTLALSKITSV